MKRITREIELTITPEESAMAFIHMGDDEQAEFFNVCGREAKEFRNGLEFQLQEVTDNGILTKDGRNVMSLIGEYSTPF